MEVRETRGGLLVAEETAAPASIREALKKIHPDLILGQEVDSAWSQWVWKVLLRQGDRPAIWLFDWREELADPVELGYHARVIRHPDISAAVQRDAGRFV